MAMMTAIAWMGVLFLIAMILRVWIKPLGKTLVPICVLAGILGFLLMNTVGLSGTTSVEYSLISGQLFIFLFINMGLTLPEINKKVRNLKVRSLKDLRFQVSHSMLSGILGMGSVWAILYALQALIGYGVLLLIGSYFDMDPTYGLLLPFGFAQGPGQAVTYGTEMEAVGWIGATQVGISFAAIGFLIAFIIGVPFARKGMQKGIAYSNIELTDDIMKGLYAPEKQQYYGKNTTYSGAIDTLTFHVALVGIAWILGIQLGKLWGLIPGYFGQLFSGLLFLNGMLVAYALRYILDKVGITKYLDRGTQNRITGFCTDMMVCAAFMAIDLQIIGAWVVPILVCAIVCAVVSWFVVRYFGARFGGENDFERTLCEWGTVSGTNATGISLARIVDPENETTTITELGVSNVVNIPASYFVMPAILGFAAGTFGLKLLMISLVGVIIGYMIFMAVVGVWGKKTFDISKGEKYFNRKVDASTQDE